MLKQPAALLQEDPILHRTEMEKFQSIGLNWKIKKICLVKKSEICWESSLF